MTKIFEHTILIAFILVITSVITSKCSIVYHYPIETIGAAILTHISPKDEQGRYELEWTDTRGGYHHTITYDTTGEIIGKTSITTFVRL